MTVQHEKAKECSKTWEEGGSFLQSLLLGLAWCYKNELTTMTRQNKISQVKHAINIKCISICTIKKPFLKFSDNFFFNFSKACIITTKNLYNHTIHIHNVLCTKG